MKSQISSTRSMIILMLIVSFNGLKAECNQPDSIDLAEKALNESLELEGENELDSPESSDKKFKLTTLAYGGTGVLFTKGN